MPQYYVVLRDPAQDAAPQWIREVPADPAARAELLDWIEEGIEEEFFKGADYRLSEVTAGNEAEAGETARRAALLKTAQHDAAEYAQEYAWDRADEEGVPEARREDPPIPGQLRFGTDEGL
ncbi:hypothetical protein ACH4OX_36235 [Streptomyces roseolus]|uniref:hypothetical protein n=1 Tax=Streptomyces roseolus TaxID=67358 RepID=UPI0037AA1A46